MKLKVLYLFFLLAVVALPAGCVTANDSTDDAIPELQPSPTHDDSHGWGANLEEKNR